MKKLVLLSLAVGMLSASFAEGVKRPDASRAAVKVTMDINGNVVKTETKSAVKAKSTTKLSPASKIGANVEIVELGNIVNPLRAFGMQTVTGPYIDYSPEIATVVTSHVRTETDIPEDLTQVTSRYSTDFGTKFSNAEVVVPADEISTDFSHGGVLLPKDAKSYEDAYVYSTSNYFGEDGYGAGTYVATKKIGASSADTKIVSTESTTEVNVSDGRFRATAVNRFDNSVWSAMPNMGVTDEGYLTYAGSINIIKTTTDGELATTIQQVDVALEDFQYIPYLSSVKIAWSVDGKYGVVAWLARQEGSTTFLNSKGFAYPMFVMSNDFGATWSEVQEVELQGPNGIDAYKEWLPTEAFSGTGDWAGFAYEGYTKNDIILPFQYDFTVTIDRWGNLYMAGSSTLIGPEGMTEEGYTFYPGMGCYSIVYSYAANEAENAATTTRNVTEGVLLGGANGYLTVYGPQTEPNPTMQPASNRIGHRLQLSQNKIGTKIAIVYTDTEEYKDAIFRNPHVFGCAWDLATNKFAMGEIEGIPAPYNFTSAESGDFHFMTASRTMMNTGEGWEVPMMCTSIYDYKDIENPNPYFFLGGVLFTNKDFKVNFDNRAPISELGEIPADEKDVASIAVIRLAPSMNAHPNPAVDFINVDVEGMVSIYNVAGQLLRNVQVANGQVNISDLPAGTMIMKAEGKAPYKFIKK